MTELPLIFKLLSSLKISLNWKSRRTMKHFKEEWFPGIVLIVLIVEHFIILSCLWESSEAYPSILDWYDSRAEILDHHC